MVPAIYSIDIVPLTDKEGSMFDEEPFDEGDPGQVEQEEKELI